MSDSDAANSAAVVLAREQLVKALSVAQAAGVKVVEAVAAYNAVASSARRLPPQHALAWLNFRVARAAFGVGDFLTQRYGMAPGVAETQRRGDALLAGVRRLPDGQVLQRARPVSATRDQPTTNRRPDADQAPAPAWVNGRPAWVR